MQGYGEGLLEQQIAVSRVYDFKMTPVLCSDLSGLCENPQKSKNAGGGGSGDSDSNSDSDEIDEL